MDKQIQESIQLFENKKGFVEVKLKTRQSFREDQEALERRLAKYKLVNTPDEMKENGENMNRNSVDESVETVNNESGESKSKDNESNKNLTVSEVDAELNANVEDSEITKKVEDSKVTKTVEDKDVTGINSNPNESEPSKLESIVMDLQQEQDRQRSTSETADKEDSEIRVPDDVITIDDMVNQSVKDNEITNKNGGNDVVSNGVKMNGQAVKSGSVSSNSSSTSVPTTNTHTVNGSRTLPNGHVNGSLTPGPRLKMRGTRLYEKNSKLSASSSDHLDKISIRGGSRSAGHGLTANSQVRKSNEQKIMIPIVAAAEVASLPPDGNLRDFTVEQMVAVFRMLRLPEKLIYRLAAGRVDGKRFAVLSDADLDTLGMRNPIIRYFRDKSATKNRGISIRKKVFML